MTYNQTHAAVIYCSGNSVEPSKILNDNKEINDMGREHSYHIGARMVREKGIHFSDAWDLARFLKESGSCNYIDIHSGAVKYQKAAVKAVINQHIANVIARHGLGCALSHKSSYIAIWYSYVPDYDIVREVLDDVRDALNYKG